MKPLTVLVFLLCVSVHLCACVRACVAAGRVWPFAFQQRKLQTFGGKQYVKLWVYHGISPTVS